MIYFELNNIFIVWVYNINVFNKGFNIILCIMNLGLILDDVLISK